MKKYGRLKDRERLQAFSRDLSAWTRDKARVFIVGDAQQIAWLRRNLPANQSLTIVSKFRLPKIAGRQPPPTANNGRRLMNPGPGGPNQIFDLVLDGQDLFVFELATNR